MALDAQTKQALIKEFQLHETDTGSPEVQIAILTNHLFDGTLKTTSEGSSFSSWFVENGWSASFFIELRKIQRHRKIS